MIPESELYPDIGMEPTEGGSVSSAQEFERCEDCGHIFGVHNHDIGTWGTCQDCQFEERGYCR